MAEPVSDSEAATTATRSVTGPLANVPMVERMVKNLPEVFDTAILAVNYGLQEMQEYFEGNELGKRIIIVDD